MLSYVPVEHQVHLESHYKVLADASYNDRQRIEIKRYLATDSFSIKSTYLNNNYQGYLKVALQINDKTIIEHNSYHYHHEEVTTLFLAPEIKLSLAKAKKIAILVFAFNPQNTNNMQMLYAATYYVTLNDYKRDFNLNENQGIAFSIPRIIKINSDVRQIRDKREDNKMIDYFKVTLRPQTINRLEQLVNLLEIEIEDQNTRFLARNLDLKLGKITTNNNLKSKTLHATFQEEAKVSENSLKEKVAIDSDTYYDFTKNKTIIGSSNESRSGYLVPYNFKGNLQFSFPLNINAALEDLNLHLNYYFSKPLLDKHEGQVKLIIEEVPFDASLNWNVFYIKNTTMSALVDEKLSLKALNSLASEEKILIKDEDEDDR